MALYGSSPVKVTRISLWIILRSKLSSSEDGKWSCYMPEMGGSPWQWKLWPPVWNLAHITPNLMRDVSSCHALSRTRCSLGSSKLWKARSGYSLPALQVGEDGFNIKEDTKFFWRLPKGRWEQAEKVEGCLVWWHGYVGSLSKIVCGERKTWKGVIGCSQFGVGGVFLRPGVGKLESTHFSIIRGFSDMEIKLDMQSLYIWISCCTTPPDLGLYLTFTSGC